LSPTNAKKAVGIDIYHWDPFRLPNPLVVEKMKLLKGLRMMKESPFSILPV
jgi:hypothetical protein